MPSLRPRSSLRNVFLSLQRLNPSIPSRFARGSRRCVARCTSRRMSSTTGLSFPSTFEQRVVCWTASRSRSHFSSFFVTVFLRNAFASFGPGGGPRLGNWSVCCRNNAGRSGRRTRRRVEAAAREGEEANGAFSDDFEEDLSRAALSYRGPVEVLLRPY